MLRPIDVPMPHPAHSLLPCLLLSLASLRLIKCSLTRCSRGQSASAHLATERMCSTCYGAIRQPLLLHASSETTAQHRLTWVALWRGTVRLSCVEWTSASSAGGRLRSTCKAAALRLCLT